MKIRYKLLASVAAVVLLSGAMGGTASAGPAGPAGPVKAPPPVQVEPDGTVVFTAVKRGAKTITPMEIIVCKVFPVFPQPVPQEGKVRAVAFTECNRPVVYISMTITLVHYQNWNVKRLFESEEPNPVSLFATAQKVCQPGIYKTKVTTYVYYPMDYIPVPPNPRNDETDYVHITACS